MYSVVYVTAPSQSEGEELARGLVKEKLAACVNIVPSVKSVYWWKGEVEEAKEVLLIIKTSDTLIEPIINWVKSHHTYTVPEVIAMPVIKGNEQYLEWLGESLEEKIEKL